MFKKIKFSPIMAIGMIVVICLTFYSCKKPAGEGGNSSIKGKVWVKKWDKYFTYELFEYWGPQIDVYIIYGDDISYSKNTKTNYNGEFEFQYLRKGNYKIYVYSNGMQDSINPSGLTTILVEPEITKYKQTVDVGTLTVNR